MKDIILKYCLQNAVFYRGKANPKAVLGKVMAEVPDARRDVPGVKKLIDGGDPQGLLDEVAKWRKRKERN